MSRDPRDEGARWLAQARSDLSDAEYLINGARFALACFLAQQAAEKALKAVLYASGTDAVFGHGVGDLCLEVVRHHRAVADQCSEWSGLDVYYIPTRYPDALPTGIPATTFTATQANDARVIANKIIDWAASTFGE